MLLHDTAVKDALSPALGRGGGDQRHPRDLDEDLKGSPIDIPSGQKGFFGRYRRRQLEGGSSQAGFTYGGVSAGTLKVSKRRRSNTARKSGHGLTFA